MKTQLEAAKGLFTDGSLQVMDIKLFPGTSRDATAEQMAEQVNRVIAQLDAGDYEVVAESDD